MKTLGILLIAFAAIDFLGKIMDYDLWYDILGVDLPDFFWDYSPHIEVGIGLLFLVLGIGLGYIGRKTLAKISDDTPQETLQTRNS